MRLLFAITVTPAAEVLALLREIAGGQAFVAGLTLGLVVAGLVGVVAVLLSQSQRK